MSAERGVGEWGVMSYTMDNGMGVDHEGTEGTGPPPEFGVGGR